MNDTNKKYRYRALERRILAVMTVNHNSKIWRAFIGIVAGNDHDEEFMDVAKHGKSIPEDVAIGVFGHQPEEYSYCY